MKKIDFEGLYTCSFTLSRLFAMYQQWNIGADFSMLSHERPTNALLYFSSGCAEFFDKDKGDKILCRAEKGSLIYIPKGSRYTIEFSRECKTRSLLLEFLCYDENGEEFLLANEITQVLRDMGRTSSDFEELAMAYSVPISSPSLVLSLTYGLFHGISKRVIRRGLAESEFGAIERGIAKIEGSAEQSESVAALARECGVSVGTFNSLFMKYCGMTPGSYRAHLRLERAKDLLLRTELNISEVALALGFEDTGYFCRFFKRSTGVTPSEWRRSEGGSRFEI